MPKLKTKNTYLILGISLWTLAVVFVIIPIWPHIYYRLSPNTSATLAQTLADTTSPAPTNQKPQKQPVSLPPVDPALPKENGLIIKEIGVQGQIHEGENWQEILKQGIWRVPDFGTPESNNLPIILAAHRWGYLNWSNNFRYLNSFYNLPKLEITDQVTINWNQRQYTYQIYSQETNTEISDYSADLILYTCQLWNSPQRLIKYAKKI